MTGRIGGETLFQVDVEGANKNGFVGFGTNSFGLAMFDNLYIDEA